MRTLLIGAGVAVMATAGASADLYRYTFEGTVTGFLDVPPHWGSIAVGDPMEVWFVLERATADADTDPDHGVYPALLRSAGITIGSTTLTGGGWEGQDFGTSYVTNGVHADAFSLSGYFMDNPWGIYPYVQMTSSEGGAFASDALPAELDLDAFGWREMGFAKLFDDLPVYHVNASVLTFRAEAVPSPASAACLAAFVGSAAIRRRRASDRAA